MTVQQAEGSVVDYTVADDRSTVTVTGKSSLHPIHGVLRPGNLTGWLRAKVRDDRVDPGGEVSAHLEFPVVGLSFGNAMYDRELPKRVDVTHYPLITLDLDSLAVEEPQRWRLRLTIGAHGVDQSIDEQATVEDADDGLLVFRGSHRFNITEFGLQPPKMLGLKVYPDFEVAVEITGRRNGR